jgi:hypothetical protein
MESDAAGVLKTDLLTGALAVVAGLLSGGVTAVAQLPAVAVGFGLLVAVGLGVAEHGSIPGVYPAVTALAALLVVASAGVAVVRVLADPTPTVAAAVVIGAGVGIVGYRIVFGVVRSVPPARLER